MYADGVSVIMKKTEGIMEYTVTVNSLEQTEKLLDEAWELAKKLPENQEYLNMPWFTREYQLTLAFAGSAASANGKELTDSWVDECLKDHIEDMKKILRTMK